MKTIKLIKYKQITGLKAISSRVLASSKGTLTFAEKLNSAGLSGPHSILADSPSGRSRNSNFNMAVTSSVL